MMSISPAHVVNYKYNTDITLNPLMDEEQSKILAISQAKIIYILYSQHNSTKSPNYIPNNIIRENIIIDNYRDNSIILIEEECKRKKKDLECKCFVKLKRSEYRIKGWDDHNVFKNAEELYAQHVILNSAIQKISSHIQTETPIESWNTLKKFSKTVKNSCLSEEEIDSFLNKKLSDTELEKFERKKITFIMLCKVEIFRSRQAFIYDNFQKRQDSLDQKIEKNLNKDRVVFVLCGKNHGNPTDEKFIPIVQDHFSKQKVPFIVVDPSLSVEPTKFQSKSV